jgi:hypothetical protein
MCLDAESDRLAVGRVDNPSSSMSWCYLLTRLILNLPNLNVIFQAARNFDGCSDIRGLTTFMVIFGTTASLSAVLKFIFRVPDVPPKEVTWSIRTTQAMDLFVITLGTFIAVMTFRRFGNHDNCSGSVYTTGFIAGSVVVSIECLLLCYFLFAALRWLATGRTATSARALEAAGDEQLLEPAA